MTRRPELLTSNLARIFREALWYRREFSADQDHFKMTEIWERCCRDFVGWTIKKYMPKETADYKRKAGVVMLGGRVTLTVDARLWENAVKGCYLSNFILAHEFGHLILEHHSGNGVTKNFQLFEGPSGMSNLPPTLEELEANFAAVFFQCGEALKDVDLSHVELARRASSNYRDVAKAQKFVQLETFQKELFRQTARYQRVVL